MKILVIHNDYRSRSGEEVVMEQEVALLRAHSHQVVVYRRSNAEVKQMGVAGKLALPVQTTWSRQAAKALRQLIQDEQPDIAHIHNTHFMISPVAVRVCNEAAVPVVYTLHNFRLVCPAATLFRDGHICEDCLGKPVPYPGVAHACFRGSHLQSAALAAGTSLHRLLGTYEGVSQFITPTEFARRKFIEGGLDPARVVSKPHFLSPDPGEAPTKQQRPYALFVGRLSPEKGIGVLLEAWKHIPNIPLRIVGGGPLKHWVVNMLETENLSCVEFIGPLEREQVYAQMRGAYMLVLPSVYYETFGMVALEALAVGTPVIVSDHGAPAEVVEHGISGWHFPVGDAKALADTVRTVWQQPQQIKKMRRAAREAYLTRYTAQQNYPLLMDIYRRVIAEERAARK